jgi:hypothetical protein
MNLKNLSDEALHQQTLGLAREERRLQIEVLQHLRETERRMLFAKRGHSSLLDYCVNELGYTRSAGQRRVDSMRVLRQLPEIEVRLSEGSLSLTHLSDAQTFFRKEGILEPEKKREVLEQLVGQSVMQAQRTLMSLTDQPERHIPERTRVISEELTEVRFVVDQETLAQLEELKALLSHARPGMTFKEAFQYGVELALAKHRVKPPKQKSLVPAPVPETPSASIPAQVRRQVYHRDGGVCSYVDTASGRKCGSKNYLELDHIVPRAHGGANTSDNLRLRCRTHNRVAAIEVLGHARIAAHVPSMR